MEKLTKGHWGKKMSRSGWEKGLTCDNFNYRKMEIIASHG